ncbi:integrase core domain-containing protein [Streptomyces sp. 378]|uniref:integrase core domain-containing protein n=1 Tax=Streptomyces sp. 378 TaxID=3049412 RepID=UPI0024C3A57D|nr:integrase core domain-containing protein [Streptomyces sp. 378]MDK1345333.1 integrase core domain-containing protein [Streptomyces sp. 378]
MGRVGSALDNAAAESFNSLIKVEYIHRRQFATRTEARLKIATWITGFYNPRRRHSAAGGLPCRHSSSSASVGLRCCGPVSCGGSVFVPWRGACVSYL